MLTNMMSALLFLGIRSDVPNWDLASCEVEWKPSSFDGRSGIADMLWVEAPKGSQGATCLNPLVLK